MWRPRILPLHTRKMVLDKHPKRIRFILFPRRGFRNRFRLLKTRFTSSTYNFSEIQFRLTSEIQSTEGVGASKRELVLDLVGMFCSNQNIRKLFSDFGSPVIS